MASTLPNPADCCVVCCENETVEVPGPPGGPGNNGTNGTNGVNAFTTTGANFNMPAEGADTASLLVGNSQWMTPNQIVYVQGAGWMEVRSKADSTHVVLRNIENTAGARYTDNVAPATLVPSGSSISPGGLQGVNGSNGSNGTNGTNGINAYTATTADFTQPAELATVTIDVGTSAWAAIGQIVFVQGGGYYEITATPSATQITIQNLEDTPNNAYPGNTAPATLITSPKDVSPAGLQGPVQNTTNEAVAITNEQATGVAYTGGIALGAWTTFQLNVLNFTAGILPTLVANQFTLPEGRYSVMVVIPCSAINIRLRLRNVTAATTLLTSVNCSSTGSTYAIMFGVVQVSGGSPLLEIQYYATNNVAAAFGTAFAGPGINEAYASCLLTKMSTT